MRPNLLHARRNARRSAAAFLAVVPAPAFAAGLTLSTWGAYLFFALVATIVIVLLLHEALDQDASRGDDDRTLDALGLPHYVAARSQPQPSPDRSNLPRA